MIIEKVEFDLTYNKRCELFKDRAVGSVLCVGHSQMKEIQRCEFCVSYKEENSYYSEFKKEHFKIVSEVTCNRPISNQLLLFNL